MDKADEISTAQKLLDQADLKGKIRLADALHTQRKLCRQISKASGDFALTVKENQPKLYQEIAMLFPLCNLTPTCWFSKRTTRPQQAWPHGGAHPHGRRLLPGEIDWPYITQVFRLENTRLFLRKGQVVHKEHKVRYGLTSLSRSQAHDSGLLSLKRQYWQIETAFHYRRDVTFYEDATRWSHSHATRNLSTVYNTNLSLFAQLGCSNAAQTRRPLGANLRLAFSLLISAHPRL